MSVHEGKATSYLIQVSEQQREFIRSAMIAYNTTSMPALDKEEFEMLVEMLEELPEAELNSPNAHHGLCL